MVLSASCTYVIQDYLTVLVSLHKRGKTGPNQVKMRNLTSTARLSKTCCSRVKQARHSLVLTKVTLRTSNEFEPYFLCKFEFRVPPSIDPHCRILPIKIQLNFKLALVRIYFVRYLKRREHSSSYP